MRIRVLLVAVAAVAMFGGVITIVGRTSDESISAAISDLTARRYNARLNHDLDAFMSTVDPARTFLRVCEQQRFEAFVRSGDTPPSVSIGRIERWGSYVRFWVGFDDEWSPRYMRNDGGRWYVSEPNPEQMGERRTITSAGVRVRYQVADEELARAVAADLSGIMGAVLAHADGAPSESFDLEISTLEDRGGDCFTDGSALSIVTSTITLLFVGLTPSLDHISRETRATIEHEGLHWLQFYRARQKTMDDRPWWVIEGWPTAVANEPTPNERVSALCTSAPSFDELRVGPRPDARVEEVMRDYTVAALLVERVSGASGDVGYWRFFDDFAGTTDPYARATGMDGRSFYASWLADAQRQYC